MSAQTQDGMNYAPKGKINRVVEPGEFNVGVTALDHGHINGMTNGLIEAGATIKYVYDPSEENPRLEPIESEKQEKNIKRHRNLLIKQNRKTPKKNKN